MQSHIEVLETGHVDRSESAFATLVLLDNHSVICGYSVGGGAYATGGTHCARSDDGGRSWVHQSVILEGIKQPLITNHLRLSRTASGSILAYGQRDFREPVGDSQETARAEVIFCRSNDEGRSWSEPRILQSQLPGPYEISNPIVVAHDGRWLAPAATYHGGLYGETVALFESPDEGETWPSMHTVFEHPHKHIGYLEQKVIECQPNRMLAIAWRQDFRKDVDIDNGISFSNDGGRSWSEPLATGIQGQTMTPIWLSDDRFCILYNCRIGQQGVRMCLVRADETTCAVEYEGTMWDAQTSLEWTDGMSSNDEIPHFKFGYPMAVRLDEETLLATHWCVEEDVCGIRWTRLRIHG